MSLALYAARLLLKPKGPVETALFDHIWQQKPVETVLAALMLSEVFLFVQNSADAVAGGRDPKPLAMAGKGGKPVMVVFTSAERCTAIQKSMPDPAAAPLKTPFKEVLRWAPIELGLAINTNSALGAECTPAQMNELRKQSGIFRP